MPSKLILPSNITLVEQGIQMLTSREVSIFVWGGYPCTLKDDRCLPSRPPQTKPTGELELAEAPGASI
jgi:hypothetical protein